MMALKTERFELRLDEETLERVDRWRSKQADLPARSEAMRRLIDVGLSRDSSFAPQFSDGEKLLVFMVADLLRKAGADHEVDHEFVRNAISRGHYWALRWEMPGIFHDDSDTPEAVREVANHLDMWTFIESAQAKLSAAEKKRVEKETEPFGKHVKFTGFDGNNETEHMSIARFFVESMGRWTHFKGRDLNSHYPMLDTYARMYSVFEPMRKVLHGRALNANELIEIINARQHPARLAPTK
jgi:uncharacterized protein YfbU (UPF0304 family)